MTIMIHFIHKYWHIITLTQLIIITALSLWPVESLPQVPGSDKTHHFIAYAFLALPVVIRQHSHWLYFCFAFIAWSGVIELIQPYVNRYGEWLDMLANSTGVFIGVLFALLMLRIHKKTIHNK